MLTRTRTRTLIVALTLTSVVLLASSTSASAGTTIKHTPDAAVPYTVHNTNPPPPQGIWVTVAAADPTPGHPDPCLMQAKWGNLQPGNRGFVQYKQQSGGHCSWGGTSARVLYTGDTALPIPDGNDDEMCVGDPGPQQLNHCVQLSDGSTLIGAGVDNTPIISARIVTCWGQWWYGSLLRYCTDDRWAVHF